MMVWFAVYCIRTRKSRNKAKGKQSTAQSTQPSAGSRDGVQTYGVVPLAPGPSVRDEDHQKIPMSTHLRRYLGWWTSIGTSCEEKYPCDPRARNNRDPPYGKRDHFAHYFGWWTCSEETGKRAALTRGQGNGTTAQSGIEATATSTGSHNEAESLYLQPLDYGLRAWLPGRHKIACVSPDDLSEQGQCRSSQGVAPTAEPASADCAPQLVHATTTGTDVRHFDGFGEDEMPVMREGRYLTTGDPSSDETSGHKTVRRRTVGIAEACDWADLSSELRRSVHSQLLLPDEVTGEDASVQAPEADINLASIQHALKDPGSVVRLLKYEPHSPKLRKVCSSPSLHLVFKQSSINGESCASFSIKPPTQSQSNPIPVIPRHQLQFDGPSGGKASNSVRSSISTRMKASNALNLMTGARSVSKSSLAFSFDRTRRSTLDVIRPPAGADRSTLGDFETEWSIDAELSIQVGSGPTLPSFNYKSVCDAAMPIEISNDFSLNSVMPKLYAQPPDDVDRLSVNECNPNLSTKSNFNNNTFSGLSHILTDDVTRGLVPPKTTAELFATLTIPVRRHSFPSVEKEIDIESKVDRKFTFRFMTAGQQKEGQGTRETRYSFPPCTSRIPIIGFTGNAGLMVTKRRGARSGKSKTKRNAEARKLTPFVNSSRVSLLKSSTQKAFLKDWQILNRLSEAGPFHSENEPVLTHCSEADPYYSETPLRKRERISYHSEHALLHFVNKPSSSSNWLDGGTMQNCDTCHTSTVRPRALATPSSTITESLRFPLSQDAKTSQSFKPRNTQDETSALSSKPDRTSRKASPVPPMLTKTHLRCGGSPIKQAFTSQSCAEKDKRKESMRRAGRLIGDGYKL